MISPPPVESSGLHTNIVPGRTLFVNIPGGVETGTGGEDGAAFEGGDIPRATFRVLRAACCDANPRKNAGGRGRTDDRSREGAVLGALAVAERMPGATCRHSLRLCADRGQPTQKGKCRGRGSRGAAAESWRKITNHPEDARPVFRNFLSSASLLYVRFHFGI